MANYRSEASQFARRIVCSENYYNRLKARAESGDLPPAVEVLLLHYAYGKPVEHVAPMKSSEIDLGSLTVEQLAERAQQVYGLLKARQIEDREQAHALEIAQAAAAAAQAEQQQAAAEREASESQSVFHKVDKAVH